MRRAWFEEHRWLLLILLAGLVVRVAIWTQTDTTPLQIDDERAYTEIARSLLAGEGYGANGRLTSMRPPLYPALLAGIWSLTGFGDYQTVRLVQIGLGLLNAVLVYWLALKLFDRRTAIVAGAVFCFYPSLVAFDSFLLSEITFILLLTSVAVIYVRFLERGVWWLPIGMGFTLGAAALARSVAWPFLLPLGLLLLFSGPRGVGRRLGAAALLCAGFAAAVGPWAVRNTELQGVPTLVDTMGGLNLYMGNYEYTPRDRAWDAISIRGEKAWYHQMRRRHPESRYWSEGERERWAKGAAVEFMRAHPWLTLERSVIKLGDFWGIERAVIAGWQQGLYRPPTWAIALGTVAIAGAYVAVAVLGFAGLFLAAPRYRPAVAFVILLFLTFMGIHALVFGHPRYHLPLIPFLAVFAAGLVTRYEWRTARLGLAAAGAGATVAFLLAVWAREILLVDPQRIMALKDLIG